VMSFSVSFMLVIIESNELSVSMLLTTLQTDEKMHLEPTIGYAPWKDKAPLHLSLKHLEPTIGYAGN
jgi:hypothetical protein